MELSLPLMKNRFGNFLMQRCFEFGNVQQIRALGRAMKGHFYNLSCDRFGCHVVQKAIETLEWDMKAALVSEILPFAHETINHRFACHVWQRIFETKWPAGDPLRIMQHVNETLTGLWSRIANDENGSLVVQCIFENCDEAEQRPALKEILTNLVEVAKGKRNKEDFTFRTMGKLGYSTHY
jgi:hypothetical protein